jgi:hypothetical protein
MFLESKPFVSATMKGLTVVPVVPVVPVVVLLGVTLLSTVVPVGSVVVTAPHAQMPNIIVAASISDITFFIIKFLLN